MYCPKCGMQNEDSVAKCESCGASLQAEVVELVDGNVPETIPNYLVQSILVTLFCCLPLGIPAIVFAAQVNGKVQSGDIQGAMESSRTAKMWCWLSFGLGLLLSVIWFVLQVVAVAAGAAGSGY